VPVNAPESDARTVGALTRVLAGAQSLESAHVVADYASVVGENGGMVRAGKCLLLIGVRRYNNRDAGTDFKFRNSEYSQEDEKPEFVRKAQNVGISLFSEFKMSEFSENSQYSKCQKSQFSESI
jgi:hypothetical protein